MSSAADEMDEVCASCSIGAVDEKCACNLVTYCSDDCPKKHRQQHDRECMKRMAEIRDRDLFEQPLKSHMGDCPICCLPLPLELDETKSCAFMPCCSKLICDGCDLANVKREVAAGLKPRCVFCRETKELSDKHKFYKLVMKRVKKNDPVAMMKMGIERGCNGNHETALQYLTKAAELGDAEAQFRLADMYRTGRGVEKDMKKAVYHYEEAAIGGHFVARHNLGCLEWMKLRFDRAVKHLIIAANLGWHDSLKAIRELYAKGHASKEDYAAALRAYQTAVEEMKSAERDVAEAFYQ